MITIEKKEDCCGCLACVQACPTKCISLELDDEGFWYPIIDKKACIECGKCDLVCPMERQATNDYEKKVYACINKDEAVRLESTSGGIFFALARYILRMGGYVAGAIYNDDFTVRHILIHRESELAPLLQSKYMQSDINEVYKKIREIAESGNPVLFCGTPCQNRALSLYLGKKCKNVILCDFICRGVISPLVFRKYIDWLEQKNNSKVKKVQFKNKEFGWNLFSTKITFENGQVFHEDRFHDPYMVSFLEHNINMRPSCHECQFKGLDRASDITLGDFWGIGNKDERLDDNKGTSIVMINTKKGEEVFEQIKAEVDYVLCTVEDIRKGNACLDNCPPKGPKRDEFFKELKERGFEKAYKKYCKKPLGVLVKNKIKAILRKLRIVKL